MIPTLPLLLLAGSPGPLELLVIFAVILILFGPRKLPGIARSIGRMLSELRKASQDFRSQIMTIDSDIKPDARHPAPGTGPGPADHVDRNADQTGMSPQDRTHDKTIREEG